MYSIAPMLRQFSYRLLCCLLLATVALPVLAGSPRSLRFENIGLEEGLSQESVLTILQDRDGFMWFGSQSGLNRFDGYRNRVFRADPADPGSLIDNYVTASWQDKRGRLWFGTRGGLVRFDDQAQRFIRHPLGQDGGGKARNMAVIAIEGDGKDGLWVGTAEGLVHLDPDSGRVCTFFATTATTTAACATTASTRWRWTATAGCGSALVSASITWRRTPRASSITTSTAARTASATA
jgi:ligand-binding sensor domain-containing protein